MGVSVEVSGLAPAVAELKKFQTGLSTSVLNQIGKLAKSGVQKNFRDGGAGSSVGKWAPLSERYARRRGVGRDCHLIGATGHLRGAVDFRPVGTNEVDVTNNTPYAVYHEQPNGGGKGIMPHRPFMYLQEEVLAEIDKILLGVLGGI